MTYPKGYTMINYFYYDKLFYYDKAINDKAMNKAINIWIVL